MLNALLIQPIRILTQMCVTSIMHIVMRLLSGRRRRFFRVISFIAAASCIFLAFQFFSLEILNTHPKKHLPTQSTVLQVLHKMTMVTENCGSDGCANKKSELFKMESAVRQEMGGHGYKYRLTKYTARLGQLTPAPMAVADVAHIDVKLANQAKMSANRASQLPRGVPPESRKSYIPDSHNHFTCIHSKEQIAFDRINDDYCDCSDSSDEPGTYACPDSRFYCTVRVAVETGKLWVPASRVNDGICDCCDGSDEWRNFTVMDDIKFKDSDQNNLDIYQAPCHDRCSSVLALQSGADRVRLQGLQAKKAYIAAAGKMNMYTAKRYGPDGAFYLLSNICYQFDTSTYHYTVCPFRDIKQQKLADSSSHVLGRESSWLVDGVGGQYRLKMAGGDGIQCPNSKSRSTIIEFVCDVKDHVISVREDEVCIYLIKFSTPAACQS